MRRTPLILFSCFMLVLLAAGFGWSYRFRAASLLRSPFKPRISIIQLYSTNDEDNDGINDTQDILDGARVEVERAPTYTSAYYHGGYPPDNEGVCTDVVWRAFKHAGYDLKTMVDDDIKKRTSTYANVDGNPDPNIDFRRVPNLATFFLAHATVLTTEINPGDMDNLTQWQGGDIVMFGAPSPHIAILSDQRDADGVPLIIHAAGAPPKESDGLVYWETHLSPITAHVRWPMNHSLTQNKNNP